MVFSRPSLRWFGLNVVRALSIAALILVISSSIVIMVRDANALCREIDLRVKSQSNELDRNPNIGQAYMPWSTIPLQPGGGFFAILSRLLIILQCILLIFAELGWPHSFFIKFVSVLGHEYGVGILGLIQALLSALILSHRIPTFPLISAFILFAVACLNIIIGLILREKVHHYRAWSVTTSNEVCPELALPKNRRISFRPRGKRSTAFNPAGNPTCSKIEKLPIYTESYESKSQHSEVFTLSKPPLVATSLGFGRQAQQGAESEWCCLPIPEHSHPKL